MKHICCTKCKSELNIDQNTLSCINCKSNYQLVDGIPIMVDLDNLPEHLQGQVKYFENEEIVQSQNYKLDSWQKSYIERFINNFSDFKGKTVLDCGTGSGYMSIELANRGANVIAADLTLNNLIRLKAIAKKLNLENRISFVCCTAEELPITNNTVDYYLSNAVLEHLPHEKEAIEEINRVSKQNCGAMITVPLKFKYINPLLIPINYVHDKRIGHLRRYDEKMLKEKFNGWQHISTYYTGHFRKVLKTIFNSLYKYFSYEEIEKEDKKLESSVYGASNIICFFRKVTQ